MATTVAPQHASFVSSPQAKLVEPECNISSTVAVPDHVQSFIEQAVNLCKPDHVHVCDGSDEENRGLMALLEAAGTIRPLDQEKRPGCYIGWTDPADVARAEKDTYICSVNKCDAGPLNNWVNPMEMKTQLKGMFDGCMRGRTMYVMPFSMAAPHSPFAKIGIQITDSPFVVVNMRIMTRMGKTVLDALSDGRSFLPCWHSVGRPIIDEDPASEAYKSARSAWPCNIKSRRVCHFPETGEVWSFGSGYGGNSLLGKKCIALRIASAQARSEGWLAEHMLILGITNPQGEKKYICAAFPSACGKTNLAMMLPTLPGWKVETIGDDIAWMRFGEDGRLYAVNPEFGFFGVAPGTSTASNPNALAACATNTIFTNVGMTESGDVWWEELTEEEPAEPVMDWLKRPHWRPTLVPNFKGPGTGYRGMGYKVDRKQSPCAHPNSRFTAPLSQCPVLDGSWDDPRGVPISAIIFGGRRDNTYPLVVESFNWAHGTFMGASMRSQATSASDQTGLVHDPMAMKPFIGYNVKDYFAHWLEMGHREGAVMPKVFHVNWFQRNAAGDFCWPGFGENCRVLQWILARATGSAAAVETPIGFVPTPDSLNLDGIAKFNPADLATLLRVDRALWTEEARALRKFFDSLMKDDDTPVPAGLVDQLRQLEERLAAAK